MDHILLVNDSGNGGEDLFPAGEIDVRHVCAVFGLLPPPAHIYLNAMDDLYSMLPSQVNTFILEEGKPMLVVGDPIPRISSIDYDSEAEHDEPANNSVDADGIADKAVVQFGIRFTPGHMKAVTDYIGTHNEIETYISGGRKSCDLPQRLRKNIARQQRKDWKRKVRL